MVQLLPLPPVVLVVAEEVHSFLLKTNLSRFLCLKSEALGASRDQINIHDHK